MLGVPGTLRNSSWLESNQPEIWDGTKLMKENCTKHFPYV